MKKLYATRIPEFLKGAQFDLPPKLVSYLTDFSNPKPKTNKKTKKHILKSIFILLQKVSYISGRMLTMHKTSLRLYISE